MDDMDQTDWINELVETRIAERLEREVLDQIEQEFGMQTRRRPA